MFRTLLTELSADRERKPDNYNYETYRKLQGRQQCKAQFTFIKKTVKIGNYVTLFF